MKTKYQGWKGGYIAHYFGHLEEGEWVDISFCRYLWLKLNGYTVRKINHDNKNKTNSN